MEHFDTSKNDYKVLVRCMTYNQSMYIEDALNGFAMQKTNFQFACLVMDDASTDGEQEVIQAWMSRECDMKNAKNVEIEKSFITFVPHRTNKSCIFAFYFLKKNLYRTDEKASLLQGWRQHCEYEAICEGDDYWIDPNKLQKQFDFLEANPDYAMCYGKAKVFMQNNGGFCGKTIGSSNCSFEDMLIQNPVVSLTTFYRIHVLSDYLQEIQPSTKNWLMGDYPQWLYYSATHKVMFLGDVLGVYRVLQESASHFSNINKNLAFVENTIEIQLEFYEHYESSLNKKTRNKIYDAYHERRACIYCECGDWKKMLVECYYIKGARKIKELIHKTYMYLTRK